MQPTMSPPPSEDLTNRFAVILELLEALQALPTDMSEVKTLLTKVEQDNELCYIILKEQGWLLKNQQVRLKKLAT
jgi:hypothetical protein